MGFIGALIGHTAGSGAGGILGFLVAGGIAVATVLTGGADLAIGAAVAGILAAAGTGAAAGSALLGNVGTFLGGMIGFNDPQQTASTLISIIVWLIIVVAIIFSLFRLWFQLLICYISIFLDVIFAPIWIMAGIIPGSKIGFGAWLRDLVANLAVFPAVLSMFVLSRVFIDAFGINQIDPATKGYFVAPLIGNPSNPNEIGSVIGFGIILMTPEVVRLIKSVLKAPGSGFGKAFLGAVGVGVAVPMNTAKSVGGAYAGARSAVWDVNANGGKGGYVRGGLLGAARNVFKF